MNYDAIVKTGAATGINFSVNLDGNNNNSNVKSNGETRKKR
jgi:hypothetical protein